MEHSTERGQRQRIGIARALYRNPEDIVLDEATGSPDNTTEDLVMDVLKSLLGRKTVIMISYRLTTLADCDTMYMMNVGRLIGRGSYEEIIAGEGAFAVGTAMHGEPPVFPASG